MRGRAKGGSSREKQTGVELKGGEKKLGLAEDLLYVENLKAKVGSLNCRVEELRDENRRLKSEAVKAEKDTHEFVAYFQQEIESKARQLKEVTEKLHRQGEEFNRERSILVEKHELSLRDAKSSAERCKEELDCRVQELEIELLNVVEFKTSRHQLVAELAETKDALKSEKTRNLERSHVMERKFLEEKSKLQRDMESRVAEIKRLSREEAQKGLTSDIRKVIADNRNMGEELAFQLHSSDELQKQCKGLKDENKQLHREISIWNEKGKEYANQAYQKDCELKETRTKLKHLEQKLSSMVRNNEQDKRSSASKTRDALNDLQLEAEGLRQLVKLKNKELKRVRQLAKIILDHRTDVEQFFIEALEEVKRGHQQELVSRVVQRSEAKLKKQSGKELALPSLPGALSSKTQPGSLDVPISIKLEDLSNEQRQQILRNLFAKVNALKCRTCTAAKEYMV